MSTVRFQHHGNQFAIRFNYNADIVDLLKTSIPSFARTYDPHTKTWTAERHAMSCSFRLPCASAVRSPCMAFLAGPAGAHAGMLSTWWLP